MNFVFCILPEISLCFSAIFSLLCVFFGRYAGRISSVFTLISCIAAIFFISNFSEYDTTIISSFGIALDESASLVKIIALITFSLISLLSFSVSNAKQAEFNALYSISLIGILVSIASSNFISLYVSLELQLLPIYFIVALDGEHSLSSGASIRFYLLGVLSSAALLLGISFIYSGCGSLEFIEVKKILAEFRYGDPNYMVCVLGLVFFIFSFCFKFSIAPSYFWLPDVMQSSGLIVVLFLSVTSKIGNLYIFSKLVHLFTSSMNLLPQFDNLLCLIGIISALIGCFGAISQSTIRGLIAYSSIQNMGYLFCLISNFEHLPIIVGYYFIYSTSIIGLFASILLVSEKENFAKDVQMGRLFCFKDNNLAYFSVTMFAVFVFSLLGLPPFSGFVAKFYLFFILLKSKLFLTTCIYAILSIIAIYYYIRLFFLSYFKGSELGNQDLVNAKGGGVLTNTNRLDLFVIFVVLSICLFFNLFAIFCPSFVFLPKLLQVL